MIKTIIYSRVSSESERQNTERQTKELQEYANRMNYDVVEIFEEKVRGLKRTIKDLFFQRCWNWLKKYFVEREY